VANSSFAILEDDVRLDGPKLSPDGRFVVYTHGPNCGSIRVVSVDGRGDPIEIASFGCLTDWTSDGKYIYYQDAGTVYRISVTTDPVFRPVGVRESVFSGPSHLSRLDLNFDVAADGTLYVAYVPEEAASSSGTIWVVNNWFEELNRLAPRSE